MKYVVQYDVDANGKWKAGGDRDSLKETGVV